jgi:hypothetical protein
MKLTNLTFGFAAALLMGATDLKAQELPGTGSGCDQLCGTVYQNGIPIGHSCVGGGDRKVTNCHATVDDCTTDPCGGFALLTSSGALLAVGTCSERILVEKDPLAVITREAAKSGSPSLKETRRSELTLTTTNSSTE